MAKPSLFYNPMPHFHQSDGNLASGYKVFFYQPSTTTKKNTYTDSSKGTPNSNPMTLNARGEFTTDVWLDGSYKVVLTTDTDSDPPIAPIKTVDNVTSLQQIVSTTAKTTNYTVAESDNQNYILADASGGAITITLLAAATAGNGYTVGVKKIDSSANTVTIDGNASETIDGFLTFILYLQNDGIELISNGSNWFIKSMGEISHIIYEDSRTSSVVYPLTIQATTTGTPAANIGVGITFNAESADEVPSNFGQIAFAASDVTAGSEDTVFQILTRVAGAGLARGYQFGSTNSSGLFSFTGAPTAERTLILPDTNISQFLVQSVHTQTGDGTAGTTILPLDDTIPQITEGDQYMTLAITPKHISNILQIDVSIGALSHSANGIGLSMALFQDATANALAATIVGFPSGLAAADQVWSGFLRYRMTAGTTSSTTFRVRAGGSAAGTTSFNARASGGLFGTVGPMSSITITELSP